MVSQFLAHGFLDIGRRDIASRLPTYLGRRPGMRGDCMDQLVSVLGETIFVGLYILSPAHLGLPVFGNEFIEGVIASLGGKKAVKLVFQENRFFRVWLLAISAQAVP